MSVVIIGGNERMVCQYADICKCYGCKAKVFEKENGPIRKKIGCPDLLILFTNTVSHKMVIAAAQEAKRSNIPVARVHASSAAALKNELEEYCAANWLQESGNAHMRIVLRTICASRQSICCANWLQCIQ